MGGGEVENGVDQESSMIIRHPLRLKDVINVAVVAVSPLPRHTFARLM